MVYYIKSKAKEVDHLLRSIIIYNTLSELNVTYVSFSHTPKEMLLKQLHWTHLNNRYVKYERFHNVAVQQLVQNKNSTEVNSLKKNASIYPNTGWSSFVYWCRIWKTRTI